MAKLSASDEELIQKFVGLQASEKQLVIKVPNEAASSTDWGMCLLVKVMTDKLVLEEPFSTNMIRAWKAHPDTKFKAVTRNCLLIEFVEEEERSRAAFQGPWTYRGDLVAAEKVTSHLDLNADRITTGQIWVQFFDLPINCLNKKGLDIMFKAVGTPLTPPATGCIGGRNFIKVKVAFDLSKPMKDYVKVDHPTMGELKVYCCYKKVTRMCIFCGEIGHEIQGCAQRIRLTSILSSNNEEAQYDEEEILKPKKGLWITNSSLLPRDEKLGPEPRQNSGKMTYKHTGHGDKGNYEEKSQTEGSEAAHLNVLTTQHFLGFGSNPNKRPRPAGPIPPDTDI